MMIHMRVIKRIALKVQTTRPGPKVTFVGQGGKLVTLRVKTTYC